MSPLAKNLNMEITMTTKYEYDDNHTIGMEHVNNEEPVPIKLLEGKYKDVVFRYGRIGFDEQPSGEIKCNFNYDVVSAPEHFDKKTLTENNEELVVVLGEVLVDVLSKEIEEVGEDFLRGKESK